MVSSYWYCKSCQCYFSGREKPNKAAIVEFYLQGRHTLLETAQEYGISVSTLQRYLKNVPQSQDVSYRIHPIAITLQMDATYWGRKLWSSHFHGCFKPQSITLSLLTW